MPDDPPVLEALSPTIRNGSARSRLFQPFWQAGDRRGHCGPPPDRNGASAARRSFRVLLVEDSKAVAEIFAMMLRELGHEVHLARSGAEALERIPAVRPEVVFSDISMPGISGYELAERLRRDPATRGMFLVAMTGYGQPEDRQRALDAGFDEHLVKPADLEGLRHLFATAAGRVTAAA